MRWWPSLTAEAVCLARAIEGLRPPEARVVDDPYARLFLYPPTRAALDAAARTGAGIELARTLPTPEPVALITARHRWIDDALLAALDGIEQVVVLGAGFDSRAWRLAGPLAGRPVLEVDHPATAARKQALALRAGLKLPFRLQADLAREPLADALARARLAAGRPTFVIWEGVSMYLDRADAVATLRALAGWVGPGSAIALDVWTPAQGLLVPPERALRLGLRVIGEPLRHRVPAPQIGAFLADGGWTIAERDTVAAVARRFGDQAPDVLALVRATPAAG